MKFTILTACLLASVVHAPAQARFHPDQMIEEQQLLELLERASQLDDLLAQQPDDLRLAMNIGNLRLSIARQLHSHDQLSLAEAAFRHGLQRSPTEPALLLGLGKALFDQHRFQEALQPVRTAATRLSGANKVKALLLIGDIHFARGYTDEAELLFEMGAEYSITVETQSRLALLRHRQGRLPEAHEALARALESAKLTGNEPGLVAWCREIEAEMWLESGNLEASQRAAEAALEAAPESHRADYILAWTEALSGSPQAASERLARVLELHPRREYAQTLQRFAIWADDRHALAIAEQAVESMLTSYAAEVERGQMGHVRDYVLLQVGRTDQLEAGLRLIEHEAETVRQDPQAFEALAMVLNELGRSEEAMQAIGRAIVREPASARAVYYAAQYARDAGNTALAEQLFQKALQRNRYVHVMYKTDPEPADTQVIEDLRIAHTGE